ncbi:MAG: PIN domain-containing protein [Candidatus Methanosuratincola petrocarbonis]
MSSSSRPSFIVDEDELQILVNLFLEDFELTYPITHLQLFKCSGEKGRYRLSTDLTQESFSIRDEDPYLEGPSYFDILECLMSSGILGFANMDEFKERLKAYRAYRNILFALDTNMIYRRFASNTGLLDPKECIIVSTVRDEITSVHNYKYTQEQVIQMKSVAPFERGLLDELVNRRMKKSRKAFRFANKELKALSAAMSLEASERFSGQEGEGDRIIARSVSKCARERNAQIVLLTADSSMTDICDAEGVEYFLFEMPREIPRESWCAGSQIRRLIADLAGVLALVKMNSAIIYGEFRGKKDTDDLKVVFLDAKAADGFKKDLEVCRELEGLGFRS